MNGLFLWGYTYLWEFTFHPSCNWFVGPTLQEVFTFWFGNAKEPQIFHGGIGGGLPQSM